MSNRNKLTTRERIAAVGVLMGDGAAKALETAQYSYPEKHTHRVGMQIVAKDANPLAKRAEIIDKVLAFANDVIARVQHDEPVTVGEAIKAADLLLKASSVFDDKKGDTYNTLVLGDIQAMDEATLLRTLQQLRDRSSAREGIEEGQG